MKQIINKILFLTITLIFVSNIFAQNRLVEIADGRNLPESPKASESETEFIKKEVKANEQAIKDLAQDKEFKCDEDDAKENLANENVTANLWVNGGFAGAFTKPKASQKLYSYFVCWSEGGKYASALGGIVIVENQKVVAHYVHVNTSGIDFIHVLPDINRNGLSEIVFGFASKIDGLMIGRSIEIDEIGADRLTSLGGTLTEDMLMYEMLAYKTSVKAGKKPVFYQEIYTSGLDSEKENWKIKKKSKRFALEKTKDGFDFVKL